MFINRGNHETKEMNRTYGFEGEAKQKHGEQTYKVRVIHVALVIQTKCSIRSSLPTFSRLVSRAPRGDFYLLTFIYSASRNFDLRDSAAQGR